MLTANSVQAQNSLKTQLNLDILTWVRVNTIGVNGLGCGLPIALRWEGTESIDPNRSGYAGHGCGRDAWGCAGACK